MQIPTPNIIKRNFFRLLRAGTFGDAPEAIEPMSAWKWHLLYQLSLMHGVSALVFEGIKACSDQFFLQLPDTLMQDWQKSTNDISDANEAMMQCAAELIDMFGKMQLRPLLIGSQAMSHVYSHEQHRPLGPIDIYFPFDTQGSKADRWARENGNIIDDRQKYILEYIWREHTVVHHHRIALLTNKLHSRYVQNIAEKELRENDPVRLTILGKKVETLSPTLTLFLLLLRISRQLLNNQLFIYMLTDIGMLLRREGHHVDFVKLQEWIDHIGMQRMSQLTGTLLTVNMGFSAIEIPFMQDGKQTEVERVTDELFTLRSNHREEWFFQQGKGIFVHTTNSSAMMQQARHSMSHIKYFPSEGISNMLSSLAHSLSHIEE